MVRAISKALKIITFKTGNIINHLGLNNKDYILKWDVRVGLDAHFICFECKGAAHFCEDLY